MTIELPPGCELVRTTREFDETTVPAGLLATHRVAPGVWGRLVVVSGSIRFGFDDPTDDTTDDTHDDTRSADADEWVVAAGERQVIPPDRVHHVRVDGPVRFAVEFHRPAVP